MATELITDSVTDIELAVKLRAVLSVGELTMFRRLLLDVVVSNAESLFEYDRDVDDV